MIYLQLFYEFFKTGLFLIGGGMAAIPFMQELSVKTGWFTHAQLINMIAISESTPGPIGINMATYVGYTVAGYWGGLIASIGMITPAMIIVLAVARILSNFRENAILESAFYGLRPASVGLVTAAGLNILLLSLIRLDLWKQTGAIFDLLNPKAIILAAVIFLLTKKTKAHPVIFIACSAVIGVIFKF